MKRTDLGMPSSEADESLQPKHLSFTPEAARPAGAPNENIVQNHSNFERILVFKR